MNGSYLTRNESGGPATALRVVMYPSAPLIQPAAGITYQPLTGGVVEALPSGPAIATVARVSLATGADLSTRSGGVDGPILLFIESGLVGLQVPGAEAVLSPGGTALIKSKNEGTVHNVGARPANVLVLSIGSAFPKDAVSTPVA